jgi:GNAT superfamily N-acetyltransferase
MKLRHARPEDSAALVEICVRTGHRGQDARGVYTDPGLLAAMYLLPYLALEPMWCWVCCEDIDDAGDGTPAGYIVGTPDTRTFAQRAESVCWPPLRAQHPLPATYDDSPQARLTRVLHTGPPTDLPFLSDHPAHLHIDLLPSAQGRGVGTRLMASFIGALRDAQVPGIHLGVSAHNPRAIAFYRHLGFEALQDAGWGLWMGRRC